MSYDLNNALTFGKFVGDVSKQSYTTSDIYNALASEDAISTERLKIAEEETNNTKYDSLDKSTIGDKMLPGITQQICNESTEKDYEEVLDSYGLTEEDTKHMIDLITAHHNGDISIKDYYTLLPDSFKKIADGIRDISIHQGNRMSKNKAALFVIDQIIHDSEFTNAMNKVQAEISAVTMKMNTEYSKIFSDTFNEVFDRIDEIKVSDPEKAKTIEAIKNAFDESATFTKQLEYAKKIGANKLTKLAKRLDGEAIYFNKKVNVTDVKVPDIRELVAIIHNNLPDYDIEIARKFVIILCKTMADIDVKNDIAGLAYVYKTINNIYIYKFIETIEDNDAATLLFRNIAEVLDCIKNK